MADNPLWTILQTPDGPYVYHIQPAIDTLTAAMFAEDPNRDPGEAGAVAVGIIIEAIEAFLNFPADWVDMPGWDASVGPGEPHPKLMEKRLNEDVNTLPPIPGV